MIIIATDNLRAFHLGEHLLQLPLFEHMIISNKIKINSQFLPLVNNSPAFVVDSFLVVGQVGKVLVYIGHGVQGIEVGLVLVFVLQVPWNVDVLAGEFSLFLFECPDVE